MDKINAWLGQVTTGHGFMVLAPTMLAVLTGQLTWEAAVPILVAGLIGVMWPENTTLATAAQKLAADSVAMVEAARKLPPAIFVLGLAMPLLMACSTSQQAGVVNALQTQPGQLFCAIQTTGGGSFLAALIDADATAASPGSAPIAVIATGAAKAEVDGDCTQAAQNVNAVAGNPVSPPANPGGFTPSIAVVKPLSPTAMTLPAT